VRVFWSVLVALIPIAVAAPVALATPLVGGWAIGFSALLLLIVAAAAVVGGQGWRRFAVAVALLGGVVGVYSASSAIVQVGTTAPYMGRLGFAVAALLLAALAGGSGVAVDVRPRAAAALVAFSGLLGAVAINLFYINTPYLLAVPLWLLSAVFALVAPRTAEADTTPATR